MPNTTSTKKHLSTRIYYLFTGIVLGWPGLIATGSLLSRWQQGATFSALSLATIHLLVLGSMLTVAFGVLNQIVPIAFQAPQVPRHVLYWHLPLHVISVAIMVGGFLFMNYDVVGIGGGMVPMFTISHDYNASLPRSTTAYFTPWIQSAVVRTIFSDVGGACIFFGLVSYTIDVISIVRARKRRRLVLPLYDSFLSTLFFVVGHAGVVLAVIFRSPPWLYPSIYLFAFGGLMALMFSYMQKIVPFLWFEYRFSKRPERKTAPLIDDMVPKRTAQSGMALYFIGVIAGFLGFLLQSGDELLMVFDWGSAICMTLGSMLLFMALRYVVTIGGTRPQVGEV